MVIYKRGDYYMFKDEQGVKQRGFKTIEEAVAAGGMAPDEQVQVSGVPYKVSASSLSSAVDDAADVMSGYKDGEK